MFNMKTAGGDLRHKLGKSGEEKLRSLVACLTVNYLLVNFGDLYLTHAQNSRLTPCCFLSGLRAKRKENIRNLRILCGCRFSPSWGFVTCL